MPIKSILTVFITLCSFALLVHGSIPTSATHSFVVCDPVNAKLLQTVSCVVSLRDAVGAIVNDENALDFVIPSVVNTGTHRLHVGSFESSPRSKDAPNGMVEWVYVMGKLEKSPVVLRFSLFPSGDIISEEEITVDYMPTEQSTVYCNKYSMDILETAKCTIHPRNEYGEIGIPSWMDVFDLQLSEEFTGAPGNGLVPVEVSDSTTMGTISQVFRRKDGSVLDFWYRPPTAERLATIHVRPINNLTSDIGQSPLQIQSNGPCGKYYDCGHCMNDDQCIWCTSFSDESVKVGKCVEQGNLEVESRCDILHEESCLLSGFDAVSSLSVDAQQMSKWYLSLPHKNFAVLIRITPVDNYDRLGLHYVFGEPIRLNHDGAGNFTWPAGVVRIKNQLNPLGVVIEDYECNEETMPDECNALYLAVVGENTPPASLGNVIFTIRATKEFWYRDFSCLEHGGPEYLSECDVSLVGDAKPVLLEDGMYGIRLVSSQKNQKGALWHNNNLFVAEGFEIRFSFRISNQSECFGDDGYCAGGDGFAFVFQIQDTVSPPTAISFNAGSTMGFACTDAECQNGIKKATAIEFDTFYNEDLFDPVMGETFYFDEFGERHTDYNALHISVQDSGSNSITNDHSKDLFSKGASTDVPNFADGNFHEAVVQFGSGLLMVYVDDMDNPCLEITFSLSFGQNVDATGRSFLGFTAATGDTYQNVDISNWRFCSTIGCVAK